MPTEYHKLVRDRIPEIIRLSGRQCAVEVYSEEEYKTALLEKLVEEAVEAQRSCRDVACYVSTESAVSTNTTELTTELADLLEVIEAIVDAYGLDWEQVKELQKSRREERGAFNERLRLLWVT
jgi:predicted house-cleaning noncanonical NTP pyrophosphatase (MazG superfamily)